MFKTARDGNCSRLRSGMAVNAPALPPAEKEKLFAIFFGCGGPTKMTAMTTKTTITTLTTLKKRKKKTPQKTCKTIRKRSEMIQKQPKNVSKTIRKCCEIGPKIIQIVMQKVAFIFSAGCSILRHRGCSCRCARGKDDFAAHLNDTDWSALKVLQ